MIELIGGYEFLPKIKVLRVPFSLEKTCAGPSLAQTLSSLNPRCISFEKIRIAGVRIKGTTSCNLNPERRIPGGMVDIKPRNERLHFYGFPCRRTKPGLLDPSWDWWNCLSNITSTLNLWSARMAKKNFKMPVVSAIENTQLVKEWFGPGRGWPFANCWVFWFQKKASILKACLKITVSQSWVWQIQYLGTPFQHQHQDHNMICPVVTNKASLKKTNCATKSKSSRKHLATKS